MNKSAHRLKYGRALFEILNKKHLCTQNAMLCTEFGRNSSWMIMGNQTPLIRCGDHYWRLFDSYNLKSMVAVNTVAHKSIYILFNVKENFAWF